MKVRFSPEAMSMPDAWRNLDDIIVHFETGRHQWIIDNIDEVEQSAWLQSEPVGSRQGTRIRDLVDKNVTAEAYPDKAHFLTLEIGYADGQANPTIAKDALAKPAYLVVEDWTSDGRFLRTITHAYGYSLLNVAISEDWLKIDHAGGSGQVPKRVRTLLNEHRADLRRVQALVDSDRLSSKHESKTIKDMQDLMCECMITVHVLHKRDSENYLPLDAIAHHKKLHNRKYQAFLALTEEQKDYFDMKSGFERNPDQSAKIDSLQKDLFRHQRPGILKDLIGGFGKSCGSWFTDNDSKPSAYISRETLEARCSTNPGELPTILEKIERML